MIFQRYDLVISQKFKDICLFFDISDPSNIDDLRTIYNDINDCTEKDPIVVIGGLNSDLRDEQRSDLIPYSTIKDLSIEYNYYSYIQGEWNIGLVSIHNSDVKQLAQKCICGDVSDTYNDKDFNKFIEADNVVAQLKLHLFDSAQESGFCKLLQGIIIVFDINDKYSFEQIKNTLNEAKSEVDDNLLCVIAANHCEMRKKAGNVLVSYEDYEKIENELNIKVIEVSPETGENVEEMLFYLVIKIVQYKKLKTKQQKHRRKKKRVDDKKEKAKLKCKDKIKT